MNDEDNRSLVEPFTLNEVPGMLEEMRADTTPGTDGFLVTFYKKF